jgi:carbon monoxide dehydrogenase subunit G
MELTGDVVINADRTRVWMALNDPVVLTACIPGCEALEQVGPLEKTARMMVKVGPVRAKFSGRILMSDVIEAESCAMTFEGSGGAAGMARGRSQVSLSDEGESTRLHYTVQASVAGKLGLVGGRMIDGAAKQMADQFFNAFQLHLAPPQPDADKLPTESQTPEAAQVSPLAAHTQIADLPSAAVAVAQPPTRQLPNDMEWLRVKWFALGVLATAFGVWLGAQL